MNSSVLKATLSKAGIASCVLLLASGAALADSTVALTAAPTSATLPDGQLLPMWGYTCGAALDGGSVTARVSCTTMKGTAQSGTSWQPPLIIVPSGTPLKITLTNGLSFSTGSGTNTLPTSLVIVGQLGGGLGTDRSLFPAGSFPHDPQGLTWPGTPQPAGACGEEGTFCPPDQAQRVRSLATEVSVGTPQELTWSNLRAGTYLIETGTEPSIQGPMGLYGVVVVTDAGYPGVAFDKDVALLLSEIDPAQNDMVNTAVHTSGFDAATVWNGQTGECGDPSVHTCYPPAVNYDPRYYLINGVSFDRTNRDASTLTGPGATAGSGRVLLRFVNAGLRMHVPAVVGADMTLLAEDGNKLPELQIPGGHPKVQSEVFLPAGKTYDVTIQPKQSPAGTYTAAALPVFDRQLSLSTNNQRDGGMLAYISVNSGAPPVANASVTATGETYYCVAGMTLSVTDVKQGVLANDIGANGATLGTVSLAGTATPLLTFRPNGTFTYKQLPADASCGGTFTYKVNGGATATATVTQCDESTPGCAALSGRPTAVADSYPTVDVPVNLASRLQVFRPGVLANDISPNGLPLKAVLASPGTCTDVQLHDDGSFAVTSAPGTPCSFTYTAVNSQKRPSLAAATVMVNFPTANGPMVTVKDARTGDAIDDYRWIIEEDRTVWIDPTIETAGATPPRNLAVNFHTSHMPIVAQGCVGALSCEQGQTLLGLPAVCDLGNGACRTDSDQKIGVLPTQAHLDPTKRYYISILPGDNGSTADDPPTPHAMSGAQLAPGQASVDVFVQPYDFPTAKISVFVFEDDYPLNGEADTGGGVDVLAPNEPGLGGFSIVLLDQTGQFGDPAGQLTYDEFGMPVSNALAHTIDPATGLDACPISTGSADGIVGMIVTCPKYEANPDGTPSNILSPIAGHAIIANMYPGLYEVHTTPGSDRVAKGEEWLQTNTLDGTKDIEAFIKPDEPAYFQEFGPGGYHVAVGFANKKIIDDRKPTVCAGQPCTATINGVVTNTRMSRTPDQRVYSSGSYDSYSFGQCYVSLGAPDGADFALEKCNGDGTFTFTGVPRGDLRVTVFDQWNDLLVDGLSTPVKVDGDTVNVEIPVTQWRTNLYGRIFIDQNGDGVSQEEEPGLPLAPYNIRYRDGSYMGYNNTDLAGYAGFNEVFPFLNWLVIDTDGARYKQTGVHVVYDSGGPVDCTSADDTPGSQTCHGGGGNSELTKWAANSVESPTAHLPGDLRIPGARYCASADCPLDDPGFNPANGNAGSAGRVDPGWVPAEGWQGLLGQNSYVEFAMRAFKPNENGGIRGHVIYTSTRPFDDPALSLQLSWEPGVPNVKINLYRESVAPDGTQSLTLVDHTLTSSWDDWAQGFRKNADGTTLTLASDGKPIPNMSCPGQETGSPFYFTMINGTQALNPTTAMAYGGRFRCYDGWSMLNQVQPAPYNGAYKFPSVTARYPNGANAGKPAIAVNENTGMVMPGMGTNCTVCRVDTDGDPMLPPGKYVVEIELPPGYELVKEEDKNILLGDSYIAPVEQQFAGFGNIFIMPDQAAVNEFYNPNNILQRTSNNGAVPRHEGDTGSVEVFWPCVGEKRIVPDLISLFPGAGQQAPFAGATRALCDRKLVTLESEMTALAKFYVFTSAHIASHFTGTITNDFASEFDPFSPQFGEKFAVPNAPVGIRDWSGKEIARVYGDQWGQYNGLNFSSWSVNPPSPSGYIPTMMIVCMNDPGPIKGPGGTMITDPNYIPGYSNFCYEIPFMPGQTSYLDTPVIPTMAFAASYNLPDCEYPDATPAIKMVEGSVIPASGGMKGPWVAMSAPVASVTVNNRGDLYTGPPAVSFTSVDGNGSGAAATATMRVQSISVDSAGGGYTSNDLNGGSSGNGVTLSGGGGSGASTNNITLKVVGFRITASGTCTAGSHAVTFTGGGPGNGSGNHAAATATSTNAGGVTALTITDDGGNYSSVPTVNVANCSEAVTAVMGVRSIGVNANGSGYTSQPGVTIVAPPASCTAYRLSGSSTNNGTCSTAAATAFLSVNTVNVSPGGSGYTQAPTVGFSGGGGSGASATANLGTLTAGGATITITALGDKNVLNHAYSGPMSTNAPYNKKFITRHYGFGSCTLSGSACTDGAMVRIGGVTAPITAWTDSAITIGIPSGVPACTIQQRNAPQALCGELEITAANGRTSIDTVTVTLGGKPPKYVTPDTVPSGPDLFGHIQPYPLQEAIDNAAPGDLIIVGPTVRGQQATFLENLLMWKPVRLQGVGAESVVINADAHPAGKMEAWRRQLDCLFGLSLNGQVTEPGSDNTRTEYDPTGSYTCPDAMRQHVDRQQFEAILGWDATGNGNLAQLLQEPTLMGAYEGAGVTVLAKGLWVPANTTVADQFGASTAGGFPDGYRYLASSTGTNGDCALPSGSTPFWRDYYSSNFLCNPSRIDGISVINSSQGGGAIFAHAWSHNLEVSNTRVHGNHGTLTGGITIGNGEFADPFICDAAAIDGTAPLPANLPGTCNNANENVQLGYGFTRNTNVHHNSVTANASLGDALYSGTPSAAGGVTFCTGSDGYRFNNNWVCGNLSAGDGGGVVHSGFINDGNMSHNQILFNQSQSPTLPTNGGGLAVLGASPDRLLSPGVECGTTTDQDCPPGLPEGTGRNLVIDANLIMGNSAESGTGGGIRLQMINGQDIERFPTTNSRWNDATLTNNIVVNNVAGWDGGGVSLQDSLRVRFINNTVIGNDTTGSAGVLFNTLGATQAATPPPGCSPPTDPNEPLPAGCINPVKTSTDQAAGFVAMTHTPNLIAALPPNTAGTQVACPTGYGYNTTSDGNCRNVSLPLMLNNVFWQNRAFHIEVASGDGAAVGGSYQQHVITLVPSLNQASVGQIVTQGTDVGASGSGEAVHFWDIGVRGDTGPTNHSSGFRLTPTSSILTIGDYTGSGNQIGNAANPAVQRQYANGARIPPENCAGVDGVYEQPRCKGYHAPAGHSEFTGLPVVFALNQVVVAATVDEGNNWVNLSYGPLSLVNPVTELNPTNELVLGNYRISAGSPAINTGANRTGTNGVPTVDFFNTSRPATAIDVGAVEFVAVNTVPPSVSPTGLDFGNVTHGTTSAAQTLTLHNNGTAGLTGIAVAVTAPFSRPAGVAGGTCGTTLGANSTCTINVVYAAPANNPANSPPLLANGTATITVTGAVVTGSPVTLRGSSIWPPVASVTGGPLVFGSPTPVGVGGTSDPKFLTLHNTGGSVLLNIALTFGDATRWVRLGGDCGVSLSAGSTCTIGIAFRPTATGTVTSNVSITGSATVSGSPVSLTGTGAIVSNLSVTKTDGVASIKPLQSTTYTIVVTNNGPSPITGAVVTDTRPSAFATWSWSCTPTGSNGCGTSGNSATNTTASINKTLGTLASGASVTFSVTGTVSSSATGTLVNTANVGVGASGATDPVPGNNSATDTDTIVIPSVSFTSESGPATLTGWLLSFGNNPNPALVEIVTLTITAPVTFGTAVVANTGGSSGTNPTPYTPGSTDTCSGTTRSSGTCQIRINFNNGNNNTKTGTLTVPYTGGAGSPAVLNLTGS